MLKLIIGIFFVINALFWGLAEHKNHCNLVSKLGIEDCPPHFIHLLMGILSYFVALGIFQYDYLVNFVKK